MDRSTNCNLSKYTSLIQRTHETKVKPKRKIRLFCSECNERRYRLDKSHQICFVCYKAKASIFKQSKQSGNKVIDDFIKYTFFNTAKLAGKFSEIQFIPYDQFKNVEFIAEGGFSKIYKAIWIDGHSYWNKKKQRHEYTKRNYPVVLKKLNNSKNVTSKELNELKIFYEFSLKSKATGNDTCITNDFYSISWKYKLYNLEDITRGLNNIHQVNIVHRDLHSGNIFFNKHTTFIKDFPNVKVVIGDLGISKSTTESTDNDENYGIIPYMAPEIFHGQKYTAASDIYSFGMIMWEFMTGRRPFWNKIHNAELLIEICDGLRPPIVTNAPEGYIDLMKECWHPDPMKRPSASNIYDKIRNMHGKELFSNNETKIIKSPDIGPVTMNHPGAIYKSRPLSGMIQSAMSTRSLSQSINLETDLFRYYQKSHISIYDKRKFEDDQIENSLNGKNAKKMKLIEDENNDYVTKELELDI